MTWQAALLAGLGGFLGSTLRYTVGELLRKIWQQPFPLGTFAVNIIGSFIIGLAAGLLAKYTMSDSGLKYFIITGFCGGFTTFSSFSIENIQLIKQDHWQIALLYIATSIVFGLLAVFLGFFLTKT